MEINIEENYNNQVNIDENFNNQITINHQKLKHVKYKDKQNEIIKKLLNILNINETNKSFNTLEIKIIEDDILTLLPDILLYFSVSQWYCVYKSVNGIIDPLKLIKNMFKARNIKIESSSVRKFVDKKPLYYSNYKIISDISEYTYDIN